MLIVIGPAARQQLPLPPQHGAGDRSQRLMQVMDKLIGMYGRNTVSVFSAGNRKSWAMRRENMSPCYTTRWRDVPVAHAQ